MKGRMPRRLKGHKEPTGVGPPWWDISLEIKSMLSIWGTKALWFLLPNNIERVIFVFMYAYVSVFSMR